MPVRKYENQKSKLNTTNHVRNIGNIPYNLQSSALGSTFKSERKQMAGGG